MKIFRPSASVFHFRRVCAFARTLAGLLLVSLSNPFCPASGKSSVSTYTDSMPTLPKEVYYYGKAGKQPKQIPLTAGPLRMVYEAGNLRYIRLGEKEVVRMIYPTVRDRNWSTILPEIRNEKIEQKAGSFRISYENHYNSGSVRFVFRCRIEGKVDGRIEFTVDGEALETFLKNRVGLCVLHPIAEHAGQECRITQPDGATYSGKFPVYIQPDQPFKNIQAMQWQLSPQCSASLAFTGEVFETEDQRNWGDASYKTYCTPQERPKPGELKQGERVQQSVTLTLQGKIPASTPASAGIWFSVAEPGNPQPLPALGVSQSSESTQLTAAQITRLKALRLSHYRVDVVPAQPYWKERLQTALAEAGRLGLPLEVYLYPGADAAGDAKAFLQECPSERTTISAIGVVYPGDLSEISRVLKEGYPNTPVGTAVNGSFVDLNRHPVPAGAEFLAYAITPQIHLFENATIVENLAGAGYTVNSAQQLAPGRPVRISSYTLRPPAHPFTGQATGQTGNPDARQMSLFGAATTVGSLKYLAEAGAASVTYYETVGTKGLMQRDDQLPDASVFPAPAGSVYPSYYIFRSIGEFGPARIIRSRSSHPLSVDGLVLSKGNARRIFLTNYTGKAQTIRIDGLNTDATLRTLDETNVQQAMASPDNFTLPLSRSLTFGKGYATLRLAPYATAIIDTK